MKYPVDDLYIYDLEVYQNYFLFGAKSPGGRIVQYTSVSDIQNYLKAMTGVLCGFNSNGYDDVVLCEFLRGGTPRAAYDMSVAIIEGGTKRWDTDTDIDSVDLINVLPGRKSLKKLGVMLAHKKLQELPVDPHKELTKAEMEIIRVYNRNDLAITEKLKDALLPELELRTTMSEKYGVDLRSKGEAQIAETVLVMEVDVTRKVLKKLAWHNVNRTPSFKIKPPSWWKHLGSGIKKYPSLMSVRCLGHGIMDKDVALRRGFIPKGSLDQTFYLGDRYYALGVGGLHSVDGAGSWTPDTDQGEFMSDWDVASYYPSMILEERLSPSHWGADFLPVYRAIVERRLAAKAAGDKVTAEVLKIVANGSFGKFGDQYSALFDPVMLAHVTVYGQLGLLVLVAMLTDAGHRVVSANTDGVTVISTERPDKVIKEWEMLTRMTLEEVPYRGLYQQNVNNYIAVTADGEIKAKGRLSCKQDLRHMPDNLICAKAVQNYLRDGTSIRETIRTIKDIHLFLLTASVNRDWTVTYGRKKMGRVMRWYKSTDPKVPQLVKHPVQDSKAKGHPGIVPGSENGVPVDDLPDTLPDDLDLDWYELQAVTTLQEITLPKVPLMNAAAEDLYAVGLSPNMVADRPALSRARVDYGEVDFNSVVAGHHMVIQTGDGILGKMKDGVLVSIQETDKPYPTRSRKKVLEDHGFLLVYGANVPVPIWGIEYTDAADMDEFYTPAELKKVRK